MALRVTAGFEAKNSWVLGAYVRPSNPVQIWLLLGPIVLWVRAEFRDTTEGFL